MGEKTLGFKGRKPPSLLPGGFRLSPMDPDSRNPGGLAHTGAGTASPQRSPKAPSSHDQGPPDHGICPRGGGPPLREHIAWGPHRLCPVKAVYHHPEGKGTGSLERVPSFPISGSPLPTAQGSGSVSTEMLGLSVQDFVEPGWDQGPGTEPDMKAEQCGGHQGACGPMGRGHNWGQGPGATLRADQRRPHLSTPAPESHWAQTTGDFDDRSTDNAGQCLHSRQRWETWSLSGVDQFETQYSYP